MKKHLLIPVSAMLICGTAAAQNKVNVPIKNKSVSNRSEKTTKHNVDFAGLNSTGSTSEKPAANAANQLRTISLFNVGTSTYQLQTNNAIQNRIVANSDGTISAAWTWSNTGTWSDRGTGYVYYDGSAWSAAPTARIEPVRTGWPSMMVTGSGGEAVITHNTAGSNLHLSTRATKGTGTWTNDASIIASAAPLGNFWPRAIVGGTSNNSIHCISISNPTDAGGNPLYYMGQQGALTYCRSQDGGATWDILHDIHPSHDSTQYTGFRADSYAIDARGNTIAYVVGGPMNDLFLMKSTDNGTTWTKTVINTFPIPMFVDQLTDIEPDGIIDTLDTNDGNVALLIDNNDDVHVWYGNMRVLNDDSTDGQYSYFPGTAGVMYWNEVTAGTPTMIAGLEDTDADFVITVSDWGTYGNSLTSMTHAAIDNMNTIHITYSGLVEYTDYGDGKSYRNIYHMSSADFGASWTTPVRINPDEFAEQVYASLARAAEPTCIKMIYQADIAPGAGVQSTSPDYANNSGVVVDQIYACLDPSTGVVENTVLEEVIGMYPNPSNTQVNISALNAIDRLEVYNALGEKVMTVTPNSNVYTLSVSTFTNGIYMVNVTTAGRTISKQLIKE